MKTVTLSLVALLFATALPAGAQTDAPVARPQDVSSVDAILSALYDVISGPAGQKRDWKRFESLFLAGAGRLIGTGQRADGTVTYRVLTPAEYAASSGAQLEANGFFEREIHRVTDTFGNVTHAFSTYESLRTAADPKPFARGINSIQLMNDGKRWFVVSIFWDSERGNNPIPAKYLKK